MRICASSKWNWSHLYKILCGILDKVNGNDPEDISLEFEESAMNAIKNIWPQIERKGYFYHLCSNV